MATPSTQPCPHCGTVCHGNCQAQMAKLAVLLETALERIAAKKAAEAAELQKAA
jgi:hypothetical protein